LLKEKFLSFFCPLEVLGDCMAEKVLDNRELSARLMALEERVGRLETAVLKGYVAQVEKAKSAARKGAAK
jgi:hypothetical protein